MLKDVAHNLGIQKDIENLRNDISVNSISNTGLIEITVKNEDKEVSVRIANEISRVFEEKVKELYNINNIHIINEAGVPVEPSNINHKKDILLFTAFGILISGIYIFVLDLLDTTVKSSENIEEEYGLPVIASVPIFGDKIQKEEQMKDELIVKNDPKSPISEIFRTLRTNIQFINHKDKIKTILVTSTMPQEGKSFMSANLAVTFAKANKKVLLIDADMRKGRQYTVFNLLPKKGISNYLLDFSEKNGETKISDYIQETKIESLSVMTAGSVPPNPSELLVSETIINLIEKLKEDYDIIILDGPPIQLVTDSIILTRIVDTTVIVAACNETKKDNLHKVIVSIKDVGGKIAGIVINKTAVSAKTYKKSYYYENDSKK